MPFTAFDAEIINEIKSIILADLQVHHSIGYLASKAGMSESRLKESFKELANSSIYAFLKKNRMQHAVMLLKQNELRLQLIGKKTGFKYYSNFTRAFKKYYGITPVNYRKQFKTANKKILRNEEVSRKPLTE